MKKTALGILLTLALFAGAQTTTLKVATWTLDADGNLVISKIAIDLLYEQEIRPRVEAQIKAALSVLPTAGVDLATMDAAIAAAKIQVKQEMTQTMLDADAANLRVFEQQRLQETIAVLQARLNELSQ